MAKKKKKEDPTLTEDQIMELIRMKLQWLANKK